MIPPVVPVVGADNNNNNNNNSGDEDNLRRGGVPTLIDSLVTDSTGLSMRSTSPLPRGVDSPLSKYIRGQHRTEHAQYIYPTQGGRQFSQ